MSVVVVFYSRYNEQSLDFLQNIEPIMDVRKLCVDEKNVRQAIMNEDVNYNIRVVPSLLIFHSNGFLEKQNGIKECSMWLDSVHPSKSVEETLLPHLPVEEVQPVESKKISVEDIEFDPIRVDTKPLFDLNPDSNSKMNVGHKLKEDQENQVMHSVTKNNNNESIMNVAQQMQKQRDMEVKTE